LTNMVQRRVLLKARAIALATESISMLNQIEIQTYLWWLVASEWPQPPVEISCDGFTRGR